MTISKKIYLGLGFTLMIFLVFGVLSYRNTSQLMANNRQVIHTYKIIENLQELLSLMKDVETGQRGYLLTGDKAFLEPFTAALKSVEEAKKAVRDLLVDNSRYQPKVKELDNLIAARIDFANKTLAAREDPGKGFEIAKEMLLGGTGKKLLDQIRQIVAEVSNDMQKDQDRQGQRVEEGGQMTMFTIIGGTLVVLAVLLGGGFFLVRSITMPVGEAVGQLTAASTQILASTNEQASGAQEQVTAVTETVATVDEVTQTADQAAQRAKSVGDSVQRTMEVGKSGRKTVEDSLAAMETVKQQVENTAQNILMLAEQAQAIGEIIATVNDIAEQTNLLALNAAIEASRAGEHGKGFAVVAGEVKTLADQSKKATGQVRQILGEIQKATNAAVVSTEDVTKGVAAAIKVGNQAGDTIRTLAEALGESARAVTQISASMGQQATGMAQIHQAMRNIDQVAKQNAAATRQAAQAAENLNVLGTNLTALIGK